MKGSIVFCALILVAVNSVHSASFYYRNGRELAEEVVPEAVPVTIVKEDVIVPVETLRIAEPVIGVDEIVSSENKEPAVLVADVVARASDQNQLDVPLENLRIVQPADSAVQTASIQGG